MSKVYKPDTAQPLDFNSIINGLAEGIDGYIIEEGDTVYLPDIEVRDKNKGKCQTYLAELESKYRVVKVPNVISGILIHILEKREYRLTCEYSREFNEPVDVWVKEKAE